MIHQLHGIILRTFWRIVAPRHPRGWLDIHPVVNADGKTANVHCHGMERWNLPNLEFLDVPVDLLGPCHGILMAITAYMKFEKPIHADENIGGCFNSSEQVVWHQATLRKIPTPEAGHENALRVVDLGSSTSEGFPKKLFAAHLISMSDGTKSNAEKIRLLRRATEIYPGAEESSREPLDQAGTNPNNYFGWEALGTALADAGDMEDALKAFQTAARRWPVQAASFAGEVRKAIDAGRLPNPSESPVSRFWFELSTRRPD